MRREILSTHEIKGTKFRLIFEETNGKFLFFFELLLKVEEVNIIDNSRNDGQIWLKVDYVNYIDSNDDDNKGILAMLLAINSMYSFVDNNFVYCGEDECK